MKAAELIRDKRADVLMKGMVDTGLIMGAVLNRENNLRKSPVISHTGRPVFQGFHKMRQFL